MSYQSNPSTGKLILKSLVFLTAVGVPAFLFRDNWMRSHKIYNFDGNLNNEKINFHEEKFNGFYNILEVTKKDGTHVLYMDNRGDDLKLEYIEITKDGETTKYIQDSIGEEILEEGQKKFDSYLENILKHKQQKGLNNL